MSASGVTYRRTAFHVLPVVDSEPASDDGSSITVTMAVPAPLREVFAFTPGQHVTLRVVIDGAEVRRSYSICSRPVDLADDGVLRIGIRVLPDSLFSARARNLMARATVEVLPPTGNFTTTPDPGRRKRYAAVVAGSGITPALSLIGTALAVEPDSTFTLLYGNRTAASAMFTEQLADLKDRYPDRLATAYLFSREEISIGQPGSRWDTTTLDAVFTRALPPSIVDEWFVCGPGTMVDEVLTALTDHGVPSAAVHTELFHPKATTPAPRAPRARTTSGELTVILAGRATTVSLGPGQDVLDAALAGRPELPFSCTAGVCGTCRARVVSGTVRMRHDWALSGDERAAGFVLTCQATAETDKVVVDYDAT